MTTARRKAKSRSSRAKSRSTALRRRGGAVASAAPPEASRTPIPDSVGRSVSGMAVVYAHQPCYTLWLVESQLAANRRRDGDRPPASSA